VPGKRNRENEADEENYSKTVEKKWEEEGVGAESKWGGERLKTQRSKALAIS